VSWISAGRALVAVGAVLLLSVLVPDAPPGPLHDLLEPAARYGGTADHGQRSEPGVMSEPD
jgi:hypothetical protein